MDGILMLIPLTAGMSFILYILALSMRTQTSSTLVNGLWSAGFLLMLVHVACAFQLVHHWSHQDAYASTARQTNELFGLNWGGGIYANYAFLIAWLVEVVRWWRGKFSAGIQIFLVFMWFNGVVVFGSGWMRGLGLLAFAWLAVALWLQRTRRVKASIRQ